MKLLETAKRSKYWLNDKSGVVVTYHKSGDIGALIDARADLNALSGSLKQHAVPLNHPPAAVGEATTQLLLPAHSLLESLSAAVSNTAAQPADIQGVFKKARDAFHKQSSSLVDDAKISAYQKELGAMNSCILYPLCNYFEGLLHAGRLRFILGAEINKVSFGVAHGLKYVHESPARGSYVPDDTSKNLNKGHLDGGATTQSCLIAKLDSRKIHSKQVPNSAGSRHQLKQGDGPTVDRIFGKFTVVDKSIGPAALPPDPLPIWQCFPPLVADLLQAALAMSFFLIAIIEAEEPSTQFGPEWTCQTLVALALRVRKALTRVLDALHPSIKSRKGHRIDWFVLSAHLLLNRAILRDLPQMCSAAVTLGRMVEDAYETMHHFSKGALQTHSAPDRHKGYNRLVHALRRIARQKLVQLLDSAAMLARHKATESAWKLQQRARAHVAAAATVAIDFIERCAHNENVTLSGGTAETPLQILAKPAGGCAGYPLLQENSHKSPVTTLDGQASADSGGDETDEEEVTGDAAADAAQTGGAPQDEVCHNDDDCQDRQNARALNSEDAEYTMTEQAAMEAMRADAVQADGRVVANPDAAEQTTTPDGAKSPALLIDAIAAAGNAANVHSVLAARKPLSSAARKLLLKALEPKYKGVGQLKNANDWAKALVKLCLAADQSADAAMPVATWVTCARARLNVV